MVSICLIIFELTQSTVWFSFRLFSARRKCVAALSDKWDQCFCGTYSPKSPVAWQVMEERTS